MKLSTLIAIFLTPFISYTQDCSKMIVTSKSVSANCFDGDGKILLTKVDGGTGPYKYEWSNGYNAQNLQAKAGKYTVKVTDIKGCVKTVTDSILQPLKLRLTTTFTPIVCPGGLSHMENFIGGGTFPYTFYYFDRNNKPFISNTGNVGEGAYRVRVVDSRGCTMETVGFHYVIDTLTPMTIDETVVKPNNKNASNGSISISVNYGIPPYSYSWSNGAKTQNLKTIKAGTYLVNVTDKNGCVQSKSILVDYLKPNQSILDKQDTVVPKLGQNYPNPFKYSTVIEYVVPKHSKSYIDIKYSTYANFNLKYELDPEENKIEIEKEHLPAGIYYYRLIVDNKMIDSKKMIIKD